MIREDNGPYIAMGKCIGCGEDWEITESEKKFFEELIRTKNYKMPKRCPKCREQKRKLRSGQEGQISIPVLIDHIHKMANKAAEGAYSLHDAVLEQELQDIATSLTMFVRQNKMFFDRLKLEEVGNATQQ